MATNKTTITNVDPYEFIDSVENPVRRGDALTLLEMMSRVTGCPPKMWGPTIVGFGRYHYSYDSGHEGDAGLTGFSPRKANLVVYSVPGFDQYGGKLAALGKHKIGKSCLYINKLADVDLEVLEQIVADSVATVRGTYETWDE